MATSLATYSAFALNNRPSLVEVNRNGSVNLNGSSLPAVVAQSWIPSVDATYDLGENTTPRRWRDLYLSRTAHVAGTVSTTVLMVNNQAIFTNGPLYVGGAGLSNYNNNSPNIGTTGAGRWGNAYFTEVDASYRLNAGLTNLLALAVNGTGYSSFNGPLFPQSAGTNDLGSSALPWKDLYITGNIYKNGVIYSTGGGSLGDLIPGADNTYDVGSVGNRWKNARFAGDIYCNNLYATNNIEALQGSLTVYNGSGNFGAGLTVGSSGVGNITVFGAVIVNNSNAVRPSANAQGSVGTTSQAWGYVAALTGYLDVLRPIATGTPVSSTSVGTSVSRYQSGYIDGINSSNVVPYADNTGSVGSAVLRYANAYFVNLPICNFLSSGQFSFALISTNTVPAFTLTPYTVTYNTMTWVRVGSIYTMTMRWTIQLTSGWASTALTTLELVFDLPVAMDAGNGTRSGVCTGGSNEGPDFYGHTEYQGDTSVSLNFRNPTIPAISAADSAAFNAAFQCKRTAA